jgi:hypothetical protein
VRRRDGGVLRRRDAVTGRRGLRPRGRAIRAGADGRRARGTARAQARTRRGRRAARRSVEARDGAARGRGDARRTDRPAAR